MITAHQAIRNDTAPILPLDQRVILENVIISRTCPTCNDTGWVWWWEDGGGDILDQDGRCVCLGCCWDHRVELTECLTSTLRSAS